MTDDNAPLIFKKDTTYTGFYEDSHKKVSVTILKLTAQETIISCSSLWQRDKELPTNKIFSIENGVEKLRFYNVYHSSNGGLRTKWVTVYADNHIPDKPEECCERPFIVGKWYRAEFDKYFRTPWGTLSKCDVGVVDVKCIRRTKCYAFFEIPSQNNRTAKAFIHSYKWFEMGEMPSTKDGNPHGSYWKALAVNSENAYDSPTQRQ